MASVVSSVAGTRSEPTDSYKFVRGTAATFKTTFTSNGTPITVDIATSPTALILEPLFLNKTGSATPVILTTITGTLVPGQEFEYQFVWNIPANLTPTDEYVISYNGMLGGSSFNFGDEFFAVIPSAGLIGMKQMAYATVSDVRMTKFNIDEFLPEVTRKDLIARNNLIEFHLHNATTKLREEMALHRARGNSENYRLFCVYYTIWSILLAARGEDGSSVSDSNLQTWKAEAMKILELEKRKGANSQGIALGRG